MADDSSTWRTDWVCPGDPAHQTYRVARSDHALVHRDGTVTLGPHTETAVCATCGRQAQRGLPRLRTGMRLPG